MKKKIQTQNIKIFKSRLDIWSFYHQSDVIYKPNKVTNLCFSGDISILFFPFHHFFSECEEINEKGTKKIKFA